MNKTEEKILRDYLDWLYYWAVQANLRYGAYTAERKRTFSAGLPESNLERNLREEYDKHCQMIYGLCRTFDELFGCKYELHVEFINAPEPVVQLRTLKRHKPLMTITSSGYRKEV